MISEQELLTKWRSLTEDKQEKVVKFIEFLQLETASREPPLGERLREIRSRIVPPSEPLLNKDEMEQDLDSHKHGIQDKEE